MPKYLDNNGLLYFWQKIKNTFALASHTHTASSITTGNNSDVETELGALDDAINLKADATHTHAMSDVTNLVSTLAGKANYNHASSSQNYGLGSADNYGHVKLEDGTNVNQGVTSGKAATPKAVKDALDAAKSYTDTAINSAVTGLYKYKGSVASEANLPTTGQSTGDVYNIESASSYGAAGANVAWNGSAWDSLGEIFTINSITNGEIDVIVAS